MLSHAEFRKIRHGIASLLQQVYITVTVLHSRLPESAVQERDFINKLRQHGEICRTLVDNIQDYLAPRSSLSEPVSLSDVSSTLIEEFSRRYPAVNWKVHGDQSLLVQADREALIACGRQLVTNAVQAGASHVTFSFQTDGDSAVCWDIIDDGSGIEDADPDRLWQPFEGNRPGQAGLGLTIVARTVAAMNGKATLRNRPSGGTQATVSLPASSTPPAERTAEQVGQR